MPPRASLGCLASLLLASLLAACQHAPREAAAPPPPAASLALAAPHITPPAVLPPPLSSTPVPAPPVASLSAPRSSITNDAIEVPPFHVLAEWIRIQPMLADGRVRYVTITDVTPGSPAAKAGIKPGVMLVAIQRIVFRGLTPAEFEHELETMKRSDWIELGIADPPGRFPDERKGFRVIHLPGSPVTL